MMALNAAGLLGDAQPLRDRHNTQRRPLDGVGEVELGLVATDALGGFFIGPGRFLGRVEGRDRVTMEVMGLMLGEFVDDYTVCFVDVFAMPQSGTNVSVEAIDHAFHTNMLDMLKQTGRPEMVVGWYHSHHGFGSWLSGMDINTQQRDFNYKRVQNRGKESRGQGRHTDKEKVESDKDREKEAKDSGRSGSNSEKPRSRDDQDRGRIQGGDFKQREKEKELGEWDNRLSPAAATAISSIQSIPLSGFENSNHSSFTTIDSGFPTHRASTEATPQNFQLYWKLCH